MGCIELTHLVALYALKILSLVEEETDLVPEYRFHTWSNCCSMYKMLVIQDRIWDARDMITALVKSDRPVNIWQWIFNADIYSRDAVAQLFLDWSMQVYDSSTYLAILDILVSVARGLGSLLPNEQDLQAAELCLQHAYKIATCLKENTPRTVKSRSYMHWVLAEEDFHRMKLPREDSLKDKGFPGLKILRGALPIYVPIKNENPTWRIVYGRAKKQPVALLESTLQAARELGDYAIEVWCIEQIISCSPEPPVERFTQLSHVQKTLMGDIFGYQRTCMSKFLLAETDQARGELLDELETIRAQRRTSFSYSLSD